MGDTNENESQIANFYKDRSVFITGATGSVGKVLVEKLLRSCSGVKNIYVLLRIKKGLDVSARLHQLLNTKIFDKIRDEYPNALNKLIAIQGDITHNGLGISESDLSLISSEVSIVFHSAAMIIFDAPLKTSVDVNVMGTRRLADICHKMTKLVALIHVSTAYSNCNRPEIDELLYPTPVSSQKIIDAFDWMDDEVINALTPQLLGDRPNTYTYTKALAETLLADKCGSLPVAIVRPSLVTAAWREPLCGWVDNINGMSGLVIARGKGILRSMHYNCSAAADIIPVDTVINLMISVAWYTAIHRPNSIMIYNCTSGEHNKITSGDIDRFALTSSLQYPSVEIFRYPGGGLKENRYLNKIFCFIDHLIPAYFVDALMTLTGRRRRMVRIYEKLHRATGVLEYFTTREWKFIGNNVLMLNDQLKGSDKETFNFDIRGLHWPTYWENYVLGLRQYILKEDNSSLPKARSNLRRYVLCENH